jgi:uncharacterized protein YqeY
MPIVDDVSEAIKEAMRAKDKARTTALRNMRAAFIEALKLDGSASLTDEQAVAILTKLGKQRKESIAAYEAGGRDDLVAAEVAELSIIEEWLPKLADEPTTRAWVAEAIAATGASKPGDMGKVMGALMKSHKGEFDGKLANQLVKEALGGA